MTGTTKASLLLLACAVQLSVLFFVLGGGGDLALGNGARQSQWQAGGNGFHEMEVHMQLRQNIRSPGRVDARDAPVDSSAQHPGDAAAAVQPSVVTTHSLQEAGQVVDGRSARTADSSLVTVPSTAAVPLARTRLVQKQGYGRGPTRRTESSADAGLSVLLIVKTGPHYFERRKVTRNLWFDRCRQRKWFGEGKPLSPYEQEIFKQVSIECLFVAGRSQNRSVMAQLRAEVREKRDVFVAPFLDSYDTMTSKTQWVLLWALVRDKRSHYVMLVDDDAYVVFGNLVPWLLRQPRDEFYAGHQHFNRGVVHCQTDPTHPNCIDEEIFQGDRYPPFASGFAYIVSRDVAARSLLQLLAHSSKEKLPGNIEDAMLGVLLSSAGIPLLNVPGFVHWMDENQRCPLQSGLLVIGNAPVYALTQFALNEHNGRPLCFDLQ